MNIGIFNFWFDIKKITEDGICKFISDMSKAKRICFSRTHKRALWRSNDGTIMLTVPFYDSIGILLRDKTGITLRKSNNGNYYQRLSDEEVQKVEKFIQEYGDIVFLRDLLDVSIALSLNFDSEGKEYTPIGLLEKNAKYDGCEEAVAQLATIVDDFISNNAVYRDADYICAMPSSNREEANLPYKIVNRLQLFNGKNVSNLVSWSSKTESLKNADGADKLEILKNSGFEISAEANLNGKNIILLDDLYMSGTTLHFVAMKLKNAGANNVYGLSVVKSFGNN